MNFKPEDYLIDEIAEYGLKVHPREGCGFILLKEGRQSFFPCANVAETYSYTNADGEVVEEDMGERMFILDPSSVVLASTRGKVLAIAHTHPHTSSLPSDADKASCKKTKLPWLIVSPHDKSFSLVDPSDPIVEIPLLGRVFTWGVYDCYSLLQAYYLKEFGIKLPDFERGLLYAWDDGQWSKFEENFEAAGFKKIGTTLSEIPLQKGDVFLMNLNSDNINHCAIFVEPDRNIIYHHVVGRLSEPAVYGSWYRDITRVILRHKELM
jgi:proteasome lid subunit RPN8/RPN11